VAKLTQFLPGRSVQGQCALRSSNIPGQDHKYAILAKAVRVE
jgi:hypothetical protein